MLNLSLVLVKKIAPVHRRLKVSMISPHSPRVGMAMGASTWEKKMVRMLGVRMDANAATSRNTGDLQITLEGRSAIVVANGGRNLRG